MDEFKERLRSTKIGSKIEYRVQSLPDIPFDIGEMYAGLMPIDMKNKSRGLYFVFEPTVGEPVDEVTIWLNGGPGKLDKNSCERRARKWN